MQGTIKDLQLIQCIAWFLLIFWVVVATTLDEKIRGEERKKREIQENITKTRLTQKIDNSNPYQSIQPILPGQQAYPVQFEPLAHIRLSRSTYKVTTFIEFKPYIASFLRFQRFLELFLTDLVDPSRVSIYKHILGGHMTALSLSSLFADPERILRRFYVFAEEPSKSAITTSEPCSPVFKEAQPRPSRESHSSYDILQTTS